MTLAAACLALLALALAWPIPLLLGRATWPSRSPAVAIIVWQAIALAGALSILGALVFFGLAPYGTDLVGAARHFAATAEAPDLWRELALSAAALFTLHLLVNLISTVTKTERDRRRHAQLVQLLSSPVDAHTRVLDSPTPVAYCLPGAFRSITVYSKGLLELLSPDELRAVIEHEKAHVTQRHDIVLVAFRAWRASLPWFPIAFRAQREVGLLIEMIADDRARRFVSDDTLARAIALVESGATGVTDEAHERVLRFSRTPLSTGHEAMAVGAALALLGVPTVLLLAPSLLAMAA